MYNVHTSEMDYPWVVVKISDSIRGRESKNGDVKAPRMSRNNARNIFITFSNKALKHIFVCFLQHWKMVKSSGWIVLQICDFQETKFVCIV